MGSPERELQPHEASSETDADRSRKPEALQTIAQGGDRLCPMARAREVRVRGDAGRVKLRCQGNDLRAADLQSQVKHSQLKRERGSRFVTSDSSSREVPAKRVR